MALNSKFSERITDIIGDDYKTIASVTYIDLFNSSIAEVVDMLPPELLLKYAIDPINLSNSPDSWAHDGTDGGPEGKKILLVLRRESSGGVRRECRVVSLAEYYRAMDAGSLYLATKHTPIYAFASDGGNTNISLFPLPTADETARIYYYKYPITDQTEETTLSGLPNEIEQAIVLKACIKILQTYISDFVQDEEDTEMQNMLLGQQKTLEQQFATEMRRYMEPDATPRGE